MPNLGVNPSSGCKATPVIKLMSAIALWQRGFGSRDGKNKKVFGEKFVFVFALELGPMWAVYYLNLFSTQTIPTNRL